MLPVWSIYLHEKVKNGHIHKRKRLGNYSLPTWSIWDRIHCTIRKKPSRHETSTKSQSQSYLFGRYTKGVSQTPRWVTNLTKKNAAVVRMSPRQPCFLVGSSNPGAQDASSSPLWDNMGIFGDPGNPPPKKKRIIWNPGRRPHLKQYICQL